MIRIINGKRYNTETATEVASYSNNLSGYQYMKEELFLTKKGAWFLYGEGGAMSKYAESAGNQSWGSSKIIPLTPEEAFEWCESHDKVKAIEQYFHDRVEEA
ncbi:hypothetical protein GCM10027443_18050 [Pontibacter brevis]